MRDKPKYWSIYGLGSYGVIGKEVQRQSQNRNAKDIIDLFEMVAKLKRYVQARSFLTMFVQRKYWVLNYIIRRKYG